MTSANEFANPVRQFRSVVARDSSTPAEVCGVLLRVLVAVQERLMPEPSSSTPANRPPTLDEDTARVASALLSSLHGQDLYWTVNHADQNEAPVAGSISDDLVEIYRDLTKGLWLFDEGKTQDAAWEWRFSYESHWGRHAVEALRALHHVEHC